jgi:hypothetical protein
MAAGVVLQNVFVEQATQGGADFAADGATHDAAQGGGGDGRNHGACWASDGAHDHAQPGGAEDAGHAAGGASHPTDSAADTAGQVSVTPVFLVAMGADGGQRLSSAFEKVKGIHGRGPWEVDRGWVVLGRHKAAACVLADVPAVADQAQAANDPAEEGDGEGSEGFEGGAVQEHGFLGWGEVGRNSRGIPGG